MLSLIVAAALQKADPIIWSDSFDSDTHARYWESNEAKGSFVFDPTEGHAAKGSMKCTFQKGQVTAGSLSLLFGRNPFGRGIRNKEDFREIWWRVYMKTEPGWQGNPEKLARALCLAGTDYSEGMFAQVWGGKGDTLCLDPATGIQNDLKVTTKYNDFEHMKWLGIGFGTTPIFSPEYSGRWICIESHVKLNTPWTERRRIRSLDRRKTGSFAPRFELARAVDGLCDRRGLPGELLELRSSQDGISLV